MPRKFLRWGWRRDLCGSNAFVLSQHRKNRPSVALSLSRRTRVHVLKLSTLGPIGIERLHPISPFQVERRNYLSLRFGREERVWEAEPRERKEENTPILSVYEAILSFSTFQPSSQSQTMNICFQESWDL
jgi:hypothetical protein